MAQHDTITSHGKENPQKCRRRNLQYLILNFLQEGGYTNTANSFTQEAKLTNEYQVCDNIDLDIILQDFSSYYLLKFNKQPLICKKINEPEKTLNNTKVNSSNLKKNKLKPKMNNETADQQDKVSKDDSYMVITPLTNQAHENILKNTTTSYDMIELDEIKPFNNFIKNLSAEYKEIAENILCAANFNYEEVLWEEVTGLENAKEHLREAAIYPLMYPKTFQGLLSPWSGILLFGPPGSGKTLLVKALAYEFKRKFFNISASVIVSKWRGESEKYIKVLFELARYYSPSIIFMDEFEALTSRRDSTHEHEASRRLKHELLIELDGLCRKTENVLFLATTNLPWEIDPAIIRRLEKRLFIPLPDNDARERMFKSFLKNSNSNITSENFKVLSEKTEGYSGSDIKVICKEAAMISVRKNIKNMESGEPYMKDLHIIQQNDVELAISKIKPTVKELIEKYTKWADHLGAE